MVKISIIIPVYNVEKYLERCLNSLINQTLKDIEIILVNDGSTDMSGNICDKYEQIDERIRVIHINNSGVSHARNVGINLAVGEYILFVDSDDWVELNMCSELYNIVQNESSDILFFGAKIDSESGNNIKEKKATKDLVFNNNRDLKDDALKLFEQDLFGYTWCKLFKSSIIKKNHIQFNEEISLFEDEEFTCRYYKYISKISITDKVFYHYIKYEKERTTLTMSNKHTDIKTRDTVYKSWTELLGEDKKEYLFNRAYDNIYFLFCTIAWSEDSFFKKKGKLKELRMTHFYTYLRENKKEKYIKNILALIKYRQINLFKLYSRIVLSKKKVT